ncbi:MAG: hypothetical protein QHH75_08910 [Bacillota bacterium]|nr:hypothetical protein [Bacillota bacterium]
MFREGTFEVALKSSIFEPTEFDIADKEVVEEASQDYLRLPEVNR